MTQYAPKPALRNDDVPKWFKDMRNKSNFMPRKFDLKPMSYNYMAIVESANRSQVYSNASQQKAQIGIGTQYHRPTENVSKAIASNATVWQDIKNLGGEIKEHSGNVLGRAMDILSRPGYMIRNAYLQNAQRNYMTAGSEGGAKMTGSEHLQAILDMTPLGGARQILRGQADDDLKAMWAGLSGKAKTNTDDVLAKVTPGWWEKNKDSKLGLAASIAGDILIDPLTWTTMGLNPGSVTRGIGGVGKLLTFDKAGAMTVFRDTVFTPTGLKQSGKTMKSDLLMAEVNKYNRQAATAARRGDKVAEKVAQGKSTRRTQAYYTQRAADFSQKAADAAAQDLKGAALAARMLKRNINPLTAMQTASRFTTGAKAGSDVLRGQATIAAAANSLYEASVTAMKNGENNEFYQTLYAAGGHKDFSYYHNGRQHVVKFSEAKTYEDWLKMLVQESAPIAAYAETSARALRGRKGRIYSTEARGMQFQKDWLNHMFVTTRDSLDPTKWDAVRKDLNRRWNLGNRSRGVRGPVEKLSKDSPDVPVIKEDDFLDGKFSMDDLKGIAKQSWDDFHTAQGTKVPWDERRGAVIIVDAQGQARKIGIGALGLFNESLNKGVAAPAMRAARAAARTPEQTAVDNITGVSDDLAGRRDMLLDEQQRLMTERQALSDRLDAATPEELQEAFGVKIVDGVITATKGGSVDDIPEVIQAILQNRIDTRLDDSTLATAGYEKTLDADGRLQMVKKPNETTSPKDPNYRTFTEDVNGEIGLAMLDAWSGAIRFAADQDLLADPANFDQVMDILYQHSETFINLAAADTKMQVMMLMKNAVGMQFPDTFIPSGTRIMDTFGNSQATDFRFTNKAGEAKDGTQVAGWAALGKEIRNWTRSALPFIPEGESIAQGLSKILTDTKAVRARVDYDFYAEAEEVAMEVAARVGVLRDKVAPKDFNATGIPEVGNYSMMDFLLHSKEILDAQKTRFVYSGGKGNAVVRMNIGRLSALDSFAAIDDETRAALEALETLKGMARRNPNDKSGQTAVKSVVARQELSRMFDEAGGVAYLSRVDDTSRTDFSQDFATLGAHARLKQGAINAGNNAGLGPKWAADLMEHVWGTPTLNHEWMKALHHRILSGVVLDGRTQKQVADDIIANVEEFFKAHEGIKYQLYPTFERNGQVIGRTRSTVRRHGKQLREDWGTRNEVDFAQNTPVVGSGVADARKVVWPDRATTITAGDLNEVTLADQGRPFNNDQMIKFLKNATGLTEEQLVKGGEHFAPLIRSTSDGNKSRVGRQVVRIGPPGSKKGLIISRVEGGQSQLYYVAPDRQLFRLDGATDFKQVDEINEALSDILTSATGTVRRDPTLQGADYKPGAQVLNKNITYTGKDPVEPVVRPTPEEAALDQRISGLQGQIDAIPAEAVPPASAADEPNITPESEPVDVDQVPTGNVAEGDEINTGGNAYTPEEQAVIRDWIEQSYGDRSPEEIGRALYGHTMALAHDMAITKSYMTTGLRDMSIKQHASVRFFGIPFMNMVNPMNATHNTANVTAMGEARSRAGKFWSKVMDPNHSPDHWSSKARRHFTKESQLLEGSLMQIRRSSVNAAAMSRKIIINYLNTLYPRVTKGQYAVMSMAGLSKKEKYAKASQALFDPNNVADKAGLDLFNQVDGSNPLKDIEANFEGNSLKAFGDDAHKLRESEWVEKVSLFNRYLDKNFQLTPDEIRTIFEAGITEAPFSRQWLSDVGQLLSNTSSKMRFEALKNHNLAAFHYSMTDAALKIEEGRDLYRGIWDEFSFEMDGAVATYMNDKVHPVTTGVDGKPMRGKLINVAELGKANAWNIPKNKIPKEFRQGDRYIDESFLPEIATLMRFMEGADRLNDVLRTGFFDKLMQYFKASVTIYKVPTYPVRNMMADAFMSAMDGVTQPKYYKWAAQTMQNASRLSKDVDDNADIYNKILDKNFLGEELSRAATDPLSVADPVTGPGLTSMLLRTAEGQEIRLNDSQIVHLFDELGLGQNQIVGEVAESLAAARLTTHGQAAGKLHDGLRTLNDWRESWARMAHFMYALEREASLGGNIQDIAKRAAERVIKHHFDYNDVSVFDRSKLARWIPFYKWVKNIIPYTVTAMVTKPYMLKTEQAIQQSLQGLSDDNDPQTDLVVPEYIKRELAVDVGSYTDPNGNKFMQWASINLPLSETITGTFAPTLGPLLNSGVEGFGNKFIKSGEGALATGVSMINPVAKAVIQGSTGQTVWAHGPQEQKPGDNWLKALSVMAPGVPMLQSMEKSAKQYTTPGVEGANVRATLLKELGVIGLVNNTEGAQIGEVKRIQDMREGQRNKLKAELMAKIAKKYPETTPDLRKQIVQEYIQSMRTQ